MPGSNRRFFSPSAATVRAALRARRAKSTEVSPAALDARAQWNPPLPKVVHRQVQQAEGLWLQHYGERVLTGTAGVHKDVGWGRTVVSPFSANGAVRAFIELAAEADKHEPTRRGPKFDRKNLLRLLDFIDARGSHVGKIVDPNGKAIRVGTADKGGLAKDAAKELHLSETRVADLLRQIAELAATLPEGMLGYYPHSLIPK